MKITSLIVAFVALLDCASAATDEVEENRAVRMGQQHRGLAVEALKLKTCERHDYALLASSATTCAGGYDCVINGALGVWPGTAITGNFLITDTTTERKNDKKCHKAFLSAHAKGTAMKGGTPMLAEMGGLTFGPGLHTHGSAINIASTDPVVTLDGKGDADAVFIFRAGSTLITCADSKIILVNGAKEENVFWVLGSALTMGADSLLVGTVLAGSAITIGTNGDICGRAFAKTAIGCETHCTVGCGAAKATSSPTLEPTPSPTPSPVNPKSVTTPSPTPKPSPSPTKKDGGTHGDPHFVMFSGEKYDFHGGCDLVLVQNPEFNNGQGLYIHIRTKIQRWWSYVDSVVVQIGSDTLEVMGGTERKSYFVNGQDGEPLDTSKTMGFTIGDNRVRYRHLSESSFQFKIFLEDDQAIILKAVKDFMRVDIEHPTAASFASSAGLMGSFEGGQKLGRDGVTAFEEEDDFGLQWQVLNTEPMLFHTIEGVQHPETCAMPIATLDKRRLEGSITREQAAKACSKAPKDEREDCVFDVIATSDISMASVY